MRDMATWKAKPKTSSTTMETTNNSKKVDLTLPIFLQSHTFQCDGYQTIDDPY